MIAGVVDNVFTIKAYVLILTDIDGDELSYEFSTGFRIKTDIVKPEFDADIVLRMSKMLAGKLKKIYETTFDTRKPYIFPNEKK